MRKHPYILVALTAALLGGLVWCCVPKEYAAMVKVRDEYKETDLALGLDRMSVAVRDITNPENTGINDIEVYCQTLTTHDFAQSIARKSVPGRQVNYGAWAMRHRRFGEPRDTIDLVASHIAYNVSNREETLTIQMTDSDPLVAAQMLDSVLEQVQWVVTGVRHQQAELALQNLKRQCATNLAAYKAAQQRYADYSDHHTSLTREAELQHLAELRNEVQQAKKTYESVVEKYARQQALCQRDYHSFAVIQSNSVPGQDTSHPVAYMLVFVLVALTLSKAVELFRQRGREHARWELGDWFSPWSITLLVWGGMGLMLVLFGDTLDPLTSQFYRAISLWLPILVVTSFLTFNLMRHDSQPQPTEGIEVNRVLFYFFFALAVVLTPLYIYKVWQIVSAFGSKDMLKDVRNLAVYGTGQGFLNYAMVLSQSVMLVSLWRYPKMPLWQVLLAMVCCLMNALAIMEKGTIFLVVLCGLYVLFERRVIRLRSILLLGGLAFVGFYGFNLMREGADSDYAKNESVLDFLGMYVLSPPVAFCRVRQEITSQFGTNTLETIYLFLNRFGFDVDVHQKLQEFVFVPVSTNVYTVMQPFFRDFGYWGVAFFAWVYGVASGVLYRLSRNGHALAVVLYTYWVYVLVLQFYQENVFLSMVAIIQLVFFISLCVVRRVRLTL